VTPLGLVLLGLFGLMIGSFLNVCISRLPRGESVIVPGSHCPVCRAAIRWYDNVPVVSYVMLGGHCRSCQTSIAIRYPLIELATAAAFVVQGLAFGGDPALVVQRLVFTALIIALFGTDLETRRLPNVLTLPGVVVGLALSVWVPPGIASSAIGAALGAGILLAIRWVWKRFSGVEAMGLGDVKMVAMIGAFLGWQQVWLVLLLASFAGALAGIALTISGARSMQSRLPFGTFLAAAAFAASVMGERLIAWYVSRM
jgi:leader peptidase (prepilin peptidase)/N-methyltransferase